MQISSTILAAAFMLLARLCLSQTTSDDNIECQDGFSAMCTILSFTSGDVGGKSIMEVLQQAILNNDKPENTTYGNHDNVICFRDGVKIDVPGIGDVEIGGTGLIAGGICVFPENLNGTTVTLQTVRNLTDTLIRSSCTICGKVSLDYPKDLQDDGPVLKFDYRSNTSCFGGCIANSDLTTGSVTTVVATSSATSTKGANSGTSGGTGDDESGGVGFGAGATSASIAASITFCAFVVGLLF